MSSQLTLDEVDTHADQHNDKAKQLMNKRGKLKAKRQQLINQGGSPEDINKIKEKIQEINSRICQENQIAKDLDAKAILNILISTDLANAMEAINKANKKVQKAVEKIDDIKRVLKYIDLFISLGEVITSTAITGTPVAQISAIIGAIDTLYQTDFSN